MTTNNMPLFILFIKKNITGIQAYKANSIFSVHKEPFTECMGFSEKTPGNVGSIKFKKVKFAAKYLKN